jgi:hypothetical protein
MKSHAVEMQDILRRSLSQSVWIPLMAHEEVSAGTPHWPGYVKTYEGICTVAFPADMKASAMELQWKDTGIHNGHRPHVEDGCFTGADIFDDLHDELKGVRLVLEQATNAVDGPRFLLHHDLILGLGVIQEGDLWVAPDDRYRPVIRVKRNASGRPVRLEIRAEYLRDFLCASGMGLAAYSFCSRDEVTNDEPPLGWPSIPYEKTGEHYDWVGNVCATDVSGMPYDQEAFFMQVVRTDADVVNDVPELSFPSEHGTASRSRTTRTTGRRFFRVSGELWRNEWLAPGLCSPRVAGHPWPDKLTFITGAGGDREDQETLLKAGKWLWFRPEVIPALLGNRNASLSWCTRDTGLVAGGPQGSIHFGVNDLGLVNAYAKDVCLLPYWQQREWHSHNIAPDGGVSKELKDAQAVGNPARTQAPEAFLGIALDRLRHASQAAVGIDVFRHHPATPDILSRIHRFRATSSSGLLELAKDVTRVVADAMDKKLMNRLLGDPDPPLGTLRALEAILRLAHPEANVQAICRPLFGINELRQADAHPPSGSLDQSMAKAGVNPSLPYVVQGRDLLNECVTALWTWGDLWGASRQSDTETP